jgi:hypothetical protein
MTPTILMIHKKHGTNNIDEPQETKTNNIDDSQET